jgi:hypothetical protein
LNRLRTMKTFVKSARLAAAAFIALTLSSVAISRADSLRPHETILYSFQNSNDGAQPLASLIVDKDGSLFGTTAGMGGDPCQVPCGTVFKLTPPKSLTGAWKFSVLYDFTGGTDGGIPHGNVIIGPDGNLYGTGVRGRDIGLGGVVFRLKRPAMPDGQWKYEVLSRFHGGADANAPQGGLIFDKMGDIFGTSALGGQFGNGAVFEVSPPIRRGGNWTESVIYSFGSGSDGFFPLAGLASDGAGDLFGTTEYGGTFTSYCESGCGTVFELSRSRRNVWNYTAIQRFDGKTDGATPRDPLLFDDMGNIYGTTLEGQGSPNGGYGGAAFELTPPSGKGQNWTENVLYLFPQYLYDAGYSSAGLIFDGAGNLYGTSQSGGPLYEGTAFELRRPAMHGAPWTDKILHNFNKTHGGATYPFNALVFGLGGELYGTTPYGGDGNCTFGRIKGCGTIFEITP